MLQSNLVVSITVVIVKLDRPDYINHEQDDLRYTKTYS